MSVAHVLHAAADKKTGAIIVQLGDVKSGESSDDGATVWQNWGWISLPDKPIAGKSAAEAISLNSTGSDDVVGGRSVRSGAIAALIKMGESCAFADGSQACTLYKLDGSVTDFTTHDNTSNGRSIYSRLSPQGRDDGSPWSRYQMDETGFHLSHVSGASLDMGSVSAPAPLDSFGSYFAVAAAMVRIETSFMSVGPADGAPSAVARADATIAALQAIQSEISALALAIAKIAAVPAAPKVAPIEVPPVSEAMLALGETVVAATAALATAAAGVIPAPLPIGSQCLATT